jgi:hypothetical protein
MGHGQRPTTADPFTTAVKTTMRRLGPFGAGPCHPAGPLADIPPGYLMATALAGEPIPPGAFSGALTRNIS